MTYTHFRIIHKPGFSIFMLLLTIETFYSGQNWGSNLCRIFRASSLLISMPSSASDCWISVASRRPVMIQTNLLSYGAVWTVWLCKHSLSRVCELLKVSSSSLSPTIVVSVQTLKCQQQFLLVLLQIFGKLLEVEASVFVLVTRRDNFLQRGDKTAVGSFYLPN